MKMTRREYIQSLLGLGGSVLLSHCAAFDKLFMGEFSDLSDSVIIIGGGFGGLSAAYYLKKQKIPFYLFERSHRLGGQIYTLSQVAGPGTWGELGAEWIYDSDLQMNQLIRELSLPLVTFRETSFSVFQEQLKKGSEVKELNRLQMLAQKNLLSSQDSLIKTPDQLFSSSEIFYSLQNQSLSDWALGLSKESFWLDQLRAWSYQRYGYSSDYLQAGPFAKNFVFNKIREMARPEEYTIRGGLGRLIESLSGLALGAFPEERLRLGHELVDVEPSSQGRWDLIFMTREGRRRYQANKVILTQPLNTLSQMEVFNGGVEALKGPSHFLQTKGIHLKKSNLATSLKVNALEGESLRWIRDFELKKTFGKEVEIKRLEMELVGQPSQFVKANDYSYEWIQKTQLPTLNLPGRSLGPILPEYQVQLSLPPGWSQTYQSEGQYQDWLSPLESVLCRVQKAIKKLV